MDKVGELQAEIKRRLTEKGISQAKLAEMIYIDEHDEDNPDGAAVASFAEALKKQLNRSSTPPGKLRRYLEILLADRSGLESRYASIASSQLPKKVLDQMHRLSAELDDLLDKSAIR